MCLLSIVLIYKAVVHKSVMPCGRADYSRKTGFIVDAIIVHLRELGIARSREVSASHYQSTEDGEYLRRHI
jgi:hypothetical protein